MDIRHHFFSTDVDTDHLTYAILIKDSAFNQSDLRTNYVNNILIPPEEAVAFNLAYMNDKISAKEGKENTLELLEGIDSLGITTLYIADTNYFKFFTGVKKVSQHRGEVVPVSIKDYTHISCILGINHRATLYDPKQRDVLMDSIDTLNTHLSGTHTKKEVYIKESTLQTTIDTTALMNMLDKLEAHPELAIDIETWGPKEGDALRFNKNTLESIAFSWSIDSGYAALIQGDKDSLDILKQFFINYTGKCIYHNGLFDIKHIIFHCFMDHPSDFQGMFYGIEVMTRHIDDTMIMTYLATNSTSGNELGLKVNTHEFTGNYAEDVKNVRLLSVPDLLKYNLIDTLATFWLHKKQSTALIVDGQVDVYKNTFLPAIPVLLEMMLIGLPMDMTRVSEVKNILSIKRLASMTTIENHPLVKQAVFLLAASSMREANLKLKRKLKPITDFIVPFNPGSNKQKSVLLYDIMKLPILDTTDSGLPSCSGKTIKKLFNHLVDPKDIELLEAFIGYLDTDKILGTFIKAFEEFEFIRGDTSWLNGNQKLGGTLSGRLSSSEP